MLPSNVYDDGRFVLNKKNGMDLVFNGLGFVRGYYVEKMHIYANLFSDRHVMF